MASLLHDLYRPALRSFPNKCAVRVSETAVSFSELSDFVVRIASGLIHIGLSKGDRIAIYLPNSIEFVVTSLAASAIGAIFVPINPLQRAQQIRHILDDCAAKVIVAPQFLLKTVVDIVSDQATIKEVVCTNNTGPLPSLIGAASCIPWSGLHDLPSVYESCPAKTSDPVAILYTSGSSGRAKGVVLSHANLVAGAQIVSSYLGNRPSDVILAALPFSFDYGYSQVTTALHVGAEVVLTNYSMPRRLIDEINRYNATCLAGVPTMWNQLTSQDWPSGTGPNLRYITNSGGKLPNVVLKKLRARLPNTEIFLMYGLTECFRSTYLPPDQIDIRPDSIGKAVPGEHVSIVRDDGTTCSPGEPGELIHYGSLVSLGYWNNPGATAKRFKPINTNSPQDPSFSISAVWSGDICQTDNDGFIYFVGRSDAMIKASGYRISPEEVEEIIFSSGLVDDVIAIGVPDDALGQRVALAVVPRSESPDIDFAIRSISAREMPPYMQPGEILYFSELPKTPNGKPDRQGILCAVKTLIKIE